MLHIAQHLRKIGHRVTFHTAENFRRQVKATGLRFVPLTGKANYDYRDRFDEGERLSPDEQKALIVKRTLLETIPDQHHSIRQILENTPTDLLVVDTMFFGTYPLLLWRKEERPPVLGCGVNPLMLGNEHFPYDISANTEDVLQVVAQNQKSQKLFESLTCLTDTILRSYGLPPIRSFQDYMYTLPDVFLQFTAAAFEAPRRKLPDTLRFVGPIPPQPLSHFEEPVWWAELDGSRPVVLVAQGTLSTPDLNEVVQPALSGLADENALVIVAAGRSDTQTLTVPANARVAPFVPFSRILPKVDVLVTNGGYGAANKAFSAGVPIVITGETEEENMIPANIRWTGAGITLRERYPKPEQIRDAVREILANGSYREAAQRLRSSFAQYDALKELGHTVDAMIAQGTGLSKTNSELASTY